MKNKKRTDSFIGIKLNMVSKMRPQVSIPTLCKFIARLQVRVFLSQLSSLWQSRLGNEVGGLRTTSSNLDEVRCSFKIVTLCHDDSDWVLHMGKKETKPCIRINSALYFTTAQVTLVAAIISSPFCSTVRFKYMNVMNSIRSLNTFISCINIVYRHTFITYGLVIDQFPVRLIAQLVEHYTAGYCGGQGSSPVRA